MPKTALITGASSGIGAATAALFQSHGFTVFGTSREARATSPDGVAMIRLDVTSDESVQAAVGEVLARTGRLDVLVNNAGYTLQGAAEETTLDEGKAQFDTNFFGTVRMVNAVLPAMRGAASGRIINIGSLGGLTAMPFGAFYSATKFALEGYSEALWHEVRPLGIAVSLIEPGFVRTGIAHASRAAARLLAAYEGPRTRALAVVARAVEHGMAPDTVAAVVLRAAESATPQLRYRVGPDARWLPLVRQAAPWSIYASGVRRKFALDGSR